MISKASAIVGLLSERLALIRAANGYPSDVGKTVSRGRLALDPADLPSITIIEDEDLVEQQRVSDSTPETLQSLDAGILLPIVIEATAACDPYNPTVGGHQIVQDIKRCIFSGDLTFDGLAQKTLYIGRTFTPRADGTSLITVAVRIQIAYAENLAAP